MANDKSSLVQIAQATLDQANQSQKVTVVATSPGVTQEVDITDIAGAAPSATNPLPVRLTDGNIFYSAGNTFVYDNTNIFAEQDTAVPADNRGIPMVILPAQGQAPISPATSDNQVSTNTKLDTLIAQTDGVEGSLSSIDGKTPALVSGRVPVDGSGVTQPVSGTVTANQGGAWSVDAVQSGTWTVARSWTLSSGTDSIAAVQSGAWSVTASGSLGRTWTLSSGTDSVAATQSGTWNITDITGTVSLPTGAATETTLAGIKTRTDVVDFGASTTAQRVAAVAGNTSGAYSAGNPLHVQQSTNWPVRLQDGAGNAIQSQAGALNVALERIDNDLIEANFGTPGNGSQRMAAMLGVGSTAVSSSNPVPVGGTRANDGTGVAAGNSHLTVGGSDGTNLRPVLVDTSGRQVVNVNSSALPTGAATETTLSTLNAKFGTQTDSNYGTPSSSSQRVAAMIGVGSAAVSASNPLPVSQGVGSSAVQLVSSSQNPYFQDFATASLSTTYTQVIASTGTTINRLFATNNSSVAIYIATGAAASEVVQYILMPGENAMNIPLQIPSGTRIAIRAQTGTISSGQLSINAFS